MAAVRVLFDTVQRRLRRDRIAATVAGAEWRGGTSDGNCWLDPITETLMLRPQVLMPGWQTGASGIHARWGLSHFGLLAADGWRTKDDKFAGQGRLNRDRPMEGTAKTTFALGRNQGVFVSFFGHNEGDRDHETLTCGWSDAGNGSSGVSLRFWSRGMVEVWDDGAYVATRSIGATGGTSGANRYTNVILLPFRRRELLVFSTTSGGGFAIPFERIPEGSSDPTITAAAAFWFSCAVAPDVEIAPLRFAPSGYVVSGPLVLGEAPPAGAALESWPEGVFGVATARVIGDRPLAGSTARATGCAIVKRDGSAFVADGSAKEAAMRVTMESNAGGSSFGNLTPFVYGAHAAYAAEFADTSAPPSGPVDVTDLVGSLSLEVPDDPEGVKASLTFPSLSALAALVDRPETIRNRPIRIMIGDEIVMDGRTGTPETTGPKDERGLKLSAGDVFAALRRYRFADKVPLDGLPLCVAPGLGMSAVRFVLERVGIPASRMALSTTDFEIPAVPGKTGGGFNFLIEVGDTAADALSRLHRMYAQSWVYGERPKAGGEPEAFFGDPLDFSSEADATLYACAAEGIAAGLTASAAATAVYGEPQERAMEIEATEVRVTGWDPRTDRAVQAVKKDAAASEPATVPADRPDNWNGEVLRFGTAAATFTTEGACVRAATFAFDLATKANSVTEWPSFLTMKGTGSARVPAWRGDLVELSGYGVRRLSSFRADFEAGSDRNWGSSTPVAFHSATYTGGTLYSAGGVGLRAILENARNRGREAAGRDAAKVNRGSLGAVVVA